MYIYVYLYVYMCVNTNICKNNLFVCIYVCLCLLGYSFHCVRSRKRSPSLLSSSIGNLKAAVRNI